MNGYQQFLPTIPVVCPSCGRTIRELSTRDLGPVQSAFHPGDTVGIAGRIIQAGRIAVQGDCAICRATVRGQAVITQGHFTEVRINVPVS